MYLTPTEKRLPDIFDEIAPKDVRTVSRIGVAESQVENTDNDNLITTVQQHCLV